MALHSSAAQSRKPISNLPVRCTVSSKSGKSRRLANRHLDDLRDTDPSSVSSDGRLIPGRSVLRPMPWERLVSDQPEPQLQVVRERGVAPSNWSVLSRLALLDDGGIPLLRDGQCGGLLVCT